MKGEHEKAISVVVCAYNEEARTEACLESLFNQDLDSELFEIVFVDDGSTDRTPEIVRDVLGRRFDGELPEFRYYRIEHGGLCAARNTGIDQSRGQIVAFIDADAIAEPDWIRRLLAPFEHAERVGVVGGRIRILNPESRTARLLHIWHYDASDTKDVIGCNMAYRRELFAKHGAFRTCFQSRGDETELVSRLSAACETRKVPHAVVYHERPESLRSWLRERRANGRFYAWLERLAQHERPDSYHERTWKASIKRLVTLSPVAFLLAGLWVPLLAMLALPGTIQIARRQGNGRTHHMFREARYMGGTLRGVLVGSLGLAMNVLGDAFSDLGYLEGVLERPGPFGEHSSTAVCSAPIEVTLERKGSEPLTIEPAQPVSV